MHRVNQQTVILLSILSAQYSMQQGGGQSQHLIKVAAGGSRVQQDELHLRPGHVSCLVVYLPQMHTTAHTVVPFRTTRALAGIGRPLESISLGSSIPSEDTILRALSSMMGKPSLS